jgi:hypothetical protein
MRTGKARERRGKKERGMAAWGRGSPQTRLSLAASGSASLPGA